jgi:hypothetical protein
MHTRGKSREEAIFSTFFSLNLKSLQVLKIEIHPKIIAFGGVIK